MVAIVGADYVAKKKTPIEPDADSARTEPSTKSVRIPKDLVVLLKLIEAAHDAQGVRFNLPAYLDSKLRKSVMDDYERLRRFLP